MTVEDIGALFPDERHDDSCTTVLRSIQRIELRILKVIDYLCTRHDIKYWLDGGTLLGAVRHGGFIPWDDDIDIVMPRRDFDRFIEIARVALPCDLELETPDANTDGFNIPCRIRDRHSRIVDTHSPDNLGRGLFVDVVPSDTYHAGAPALPFELAFKHVYSNATKVYDLLRRSRQRYAGIAAATLCVVALQALARAGVRSLRCFSRMFMSYSHFQRTDIGAPGYGYDVRWIRIFERNHIYPLRRIRFEDAEFLAPNNPDGVLKVFYGLGYMTPPEPSKRASKHLRALVLDMRLSDATERVEDTA